MSSTNQTLISVTIKRVGFIIEIEGSQASVTFYPYDKNRTFDSILSKLKELGEDLTLHNAEGDIDPEIINERNHIEVQVTDIYRKHYHELESRMIRDEDQLLIIANSHIKYRFRDQTGRYYAVIEREDHLETMNMDYEEFDQFLVNLFYDAERRLISKDKRNNAKALLKAKTTEQRTLYNRIARIGDTIYYDLNNEKWECVKITKVGWEIVDNPLLFRRISNDREQLIPNRYYDPTRRYVKELVDRSTIKDKNQKIVDEVYSITLFIPDIAHPLIVPIGPRGSGKTVHFKIKKLIVDPRDSFDALVERLPRDERDRRVAIYDNHLSYFDNESYLSHDEMDELCTWVTGYSKTVRILNTTDERRTYSGKRPIGINGVNLPLSNSDILNRCLIEEFDEFSTDFPTTADSKDSKDGKIQIERETKYLQEIRNSTPQILGYIFDIIAKAFERFGEVDTKVNPTHRLADWVIWGETIARVLGYSDGEFLNAWNVCMHTQNLSVIHNNNFATLLIKYSFNKRPEIEFSIEPEELVKELKAYSDEMGIDYYSDRQFPHNGVWLSRRLNEIKQDLKSAGLVIEMFKSGERIISIRKEVSDYKVNEN